jgi:hypothetical protein
MKISCPEANLKAVCMIAVLSHSLDLSKEHVLIS